jgi:pimeloyl-ACP methyl ester carboxylesterase
MLTPMGDGSSLRALLQADCVTHRLPDISAPTLLARGDEGPSRQPMRVMEQKIKGARFVLLSPAGHLADRDQPEAFNDAVLECLADLPKQP